MKKVLSYLLVLVMMLSLVACGSKSSDKKSSKEEKVDAIETIISISENFDDLRYVDAELTLKADAEAEGEKVKIDAALELAIANFLQNGMEASMPFSASVTDMDDIEGTAYWSEGYLYADVMGQKMKLQADLDFDDFAGLFTFENDEEISDEDKKEIEDTLNPTAKKSGDNYIVTMELDWDTIKESMDEEALEGVEIQVDKCTITLTANEDYFLENITFTMKLNGEYEGVAVNAELDFTINLSTKNKEIELPDFSEYTDMSDYLDYYM